MDAAVDKQLEDLRAYLHMTGVTLTSVQLGYVRKCLCCAFLDGQIDFSDKLREAANG